MRRAEHDFAGGVSVPEDKAHRDAAPLHPRLPSRLRIPLDGRGGTLSLGIARGTRVLRGEVIARDADGTALHAPTSGRALGATHDGRPWLLFECDGLDEAVAPVARVRNRPSPEDFIDSLRDAGIVGMGGGAYPLHRKLAHARAGGVHTLVVNAVECEPGLTADETLIRTRADRLLDAADALCAALNDAHLIVAVDTRDSGVIAALDTARPDLDMVLVPGRYPAGAERMLVTLLTGTPLAPLERPHTRGLLFVNVATLNAVEEWRSNGLPVTQRLLSLCGPALPAPGTAWARIGHVIHDLLAAAGLDRDGATRLDLRDGGPISGRPIAADAGIGRATIGIYASADPAPTALACIRCGRCSVACPERLAPQVLHAHASESRLAALVDAGLDACIECGVCDVVCPSAIPLLSEFRAAKRAVAAHREAEAAAGAARRRVEAHEQRLRAVAADAEARRRARLAARLGPPRT